MIFLFRADWYYVFLYNFFISRYKNHKIKSVFHFDWTEFESNIQHLLSKLYSIYLCKVVMRVFMSDCSTVSNLKNASKPYHAVLDVSRVSFPFCLIYLGRKFGQGLWPIAGHQSLIYTTYSNYFKYENLQLLFSTFN